MKKLIVMLGAVAMAACVQAAAYVWTNPYGLNAYDSPGDSGPFYSGTVYLMNNATVSQTAFISAVLGGSDYQAAFNTQIGSAFKSAAVDTGASFTDSSLAAGSQASFYVVALDTVNNGVYVSELTDVTVTDIGSVSLEFYHDAAYANGAFADTQTSFAGAGWYTAVPEPTSGLLMLVGLAGLALRRRRA